MSLRKTLIAGSLAAAGGLALLAGGASAATLPVPAAPAIAQPGIAGGEIVQINHRKWHRWNRHRHGPRYRHRRPGWGYYHRGYWYRTPWWGVTVPIVPPVVVAPPRYRGNAHVAWCSQRYRSYNPATDRYLGYDGIYHRCNSPY